jgi:hypothetical protein
MRIYWLFCSVLGKIAEQDSGKVEPPYTKGMTDNFEKGDTESITMFVLNSMEFSC